MKKFPLHIQIILSIILAILFGIFLPNQVRFIEWIGTIFLRALKMIVVPLVFASLISGITNIGSGGNLGRLGLKTLLYYFSTSLLAILTGLVLVNLFQPGAGTVGIDSFIGDKPNLSSKPLLETVVELVPENIISALANGNMLSIILFAILFGIFITKVKTNYRVHLEKFFSGIFEVMMKLTLFIIKLAPFGIFAIVANVVAETADLTDLAIRLGKFMLVVILGLAIHSGLTLPLILRLIGKVNPLKHIRAVKTALLTAFSTASSNATLPLTLEEVEDNAGVSNKISSFTLPLGATINMDGTALYELVVVGFVAQLNGIDLSISQQFIIVVTALLSSIGTAGVPMASYVTMSIIFTAVGLPMEAIALILPIDRPLDMLRTGVNVFGDTVGAVTIASSEGEPLKIK